VKRHKVLATAGMVAAGLMVVATACGSSSGAKTAGAPSSNTASSGGGSAKGGDYVIGFSDGLTGELAGVTQPELQGAKAVFSAVNAAGGVDGHKIKLIALDQGAVGSGRASANILQLATADHASAVLGMLISNDCTGAAAAAATNKIPLLCQHAAVSNVVPPAPYLFMSDEIESEEIPAQLSFMRTLLPNGHNMRVDILTNDNIGADNWAAALKKQLQGQGVTVPHVLNMPEDATSIAPYAQQLVSDKPDLVFMEVIQAFEPSLVTDLKNAGVTPPIVATLGDGDWATFKNYPNLYGIFLAQALQPGASGLTSGQAALIKGYAAAGATTATAINAGEGPANLNGPEAVVDALKVCGYPCSGPQMSAALDKVPNVAVPGVMPSGTFGYSSTNHTGAKSYTFWHWSNGQLTQVGAKSYPAGSPK
jgi:branched-chain amino acid transport system substrate-binding protein